MLSALCLLALLGPGVLLRSWLPRGRAVELPLLAAAVWVVAFWWLRLLPGTWTLPVAVLGGASLLAGAWRGRKTTVDLPSLAVWTLAAAAALVLVLAAPVPPGVDAAMHSAVARVLVETGGHPAGFRPYWPIDSFPVYPVGQPTLTALLASFAGLPFPLASRLGHALTYALVLVAFAGAVGRWANGRQSGLWAGAGGVLCARAPLYFWTWGGAPNALSLAFAVAALGAGLEVLRAPPALAPAAARPLDRDGVPSAESRAPLGSALACGLYAAASLLSHGTSVAALAWALPPLLACALLLTPALRPRVPWLLGAAAFSALLCAPVLAAPRAVLSAGEVAWVRRYVLEMTHGDLLGTLRLFPSMLHDVPVLAGAAALLCLLALRPRQAAFPLALWAALTLLMLNGLGFWLPLSPALYPDRIAVLALFPLALLAHDAASALASTRWRRLLWPACALLALHAIALQGRLLKSGVEHTLASAADLRALGALDAALPKGCPVLTNYGDAGQWIPALLLRPVTFPQVHVVFFDEVDEGLHPCGAFRGERRPYHVDEVGARCPGPSCAPLLRDGQAEAFAITDPALRVHVGGRQ